MSDWLVYVGAFLGLVAVVAIGVFVYRLFSSWGSDDHPIG